ncbi:hypothetical protein [Teredinibacter sp. KSP-S5-2]|uniref:hypothetical protein n=1 Tax=Teredinibacter sp. KSP-S5-2 TaxID=3034506 RepID=UPI0029349290|nr:hypothetical protein [Teredinibacter sp. KSP-S5-2]WNO11653.1 hypothetical protein P5V12_10765 [Teredinibacter sp. KSP-S5-2]
MNKFLLSGGVFSIVAAMLHIAIIIGGPDWYLFWGAGEEMASLAENGSWIPPITTFGIFMVLLVWGLYALSGASLIIKLPFLKTVLVIVSSAYTIRGLWLPYALFFNPDDMTSFMVWTSLTSLAVGIVHIVGAKQVWLSLSGIQTGKVSVQRA